MDSLPIRDVFAAEVNTIFKVLTDEEKTFEITLVEVQRIVSNKIQECFTLLFRAPTGAPEVQQIFQLEHSTLGKMELFLVPVKSDESGLFYEAVFNKLLA